MGFREEREEHCEAWNLLHEAIGVFSDPSRQEFFDEGPSSLEEQRCIALGRVPGKLAIALVASVDRQGATRIISARYASEKEERLYYEG